MCRRRKLRTYWGHASSWFLDYSYLYFLCQFIGGGASPCTPWIFVTAHRYITLLSEGYVLQNIEVLINQYRWRSFLTCSPYDIICGWWPLTFDLMTQKYIHMISIVQCAYMYYVCFQLVKWLSRYAERSIFAYKISFVTFDLWPHDPKVLPDHRLH